ncbi:MAG: MFS transporter [Marinifilaceae bacterium]
MPKTEEINTINIDDMPLSWRHIRIVAIASVGQFLGGVLAIIISIIAPLISIIHHPELSSWLQGFIFSCGLSGIMAGSLLFGNLGDRYGYARFFKLCPLIILGGALWIIYSQSLTLLAINLFLIGLGIGGGYAIGPAYISELMPDRWKRTMLAVAKCTSVVGNVIMIILGYFILKAENNPYIWNKLFLFIAAVSVINFLARLPFKESPKWLALQGRVDEAQKSARLFLGKKVCFDPNRAKAKVVKDMSWKQLFTKENKAKIILTGIPWACEGMGVYGIGIFTPTLLLTIGAVHAGNTPFIQLMEALEFTLYINLAVLMGFIVGISIINKVNPIRNEAIGFFVSAFGLLIVMLGYLFHWDMWLLLVGFFVFEIALNVGPHMVTFVLPSRVYAAEMRASGDGVASAIGKLGAIIATFIIPPLMSFGGGVLVLLVATVILIIGGIVVILYGPIVPLRGNSPKP